ncbi:MAG TPA: hypothetical protein VKX25_11700 [Bryobacteraceae bacterium]|jgi:hypothetical protein|nr:hypothetical protein [Bryobacteraceae bacterium]
MLRTLSSAPKGLFALALLLIAGSCAHQGMQRTWRADTKPAANLRLQAVEAKGRPRLYPYSVVPGGIHSVEEFSRKPDRIARAHYAGLRATGIVTNAAAGSYYVSFRKAGVIFWTRHRIQIPAGEKLVQLAGSDQIPYARTRCGNLLSKTPQQPNLPEREDRQASAEAEQAVPQVPVDTHRIGGPVAPEEVAVAAGLPTVAGETSGGGANSKPWLSGADSAGGFGGVGGAAPGSGNTSKKPGSNLETTPGAAIVPTPEPSGYWLLLAGFVLLWCLRKIRRTAKLRTE